MKRARTFRARFAPRTGRGQFALGVIAAGLIVLVVVLATSVDFGGGKKPPPPAKLPALTKRFADKSFGASGFLLADWTGIGGPGFVRLANRGGTAVVATVSQQGAVGSTQSQVNTALSSLRHTYHSLTVQQGPGTSLGGLPATSRVVFATNKKHVPIRILVAAAQGKHHSYVLEAFTPTKAPLNDLVETQQVVLVLRLAS